MVPGVGFLEEDLETVLFFGLVTSSWKTYLVS